MGVTIHSLAGSCIFARKRIYLKGGGSLTTWVNFSLPWNGGGQTFPFDLGKLSSEKNCMV